MSPPARQSVARISEDTGIHIATLYAWRKGWRLERWLSFRCHLTRNQVVSGSFVACMIVPAVSVA
jgi:hypothetical protein